VASARAALRWSLGAALACACGCLPPPPSHALRVRHPERKCALIWFSGCSALLGERGDEAEQAETDADAGAAQPAELATRP
jgi:hypothetical protein